MPAQDDYEALSALAERLQLDDKERDSFVTSSMQRLGYKPRTDWDEPEEEGSSGGSSDFFSGKRQQRQTRQVDDRQRGGGQRRASGAPWGYGD